MKTVNMHEAKTHLSKLVNGAAKGEPFIIAKAGEPMVEVRAVAPPAKRQVRRVGFMVGYGAVPDDIKGFGREEIAEMFGLND